MAFGRRGRAAHRRSTRAKIDATVPWDEPERPEAPATTGPWDLTDLPDDRIDRVDLGSLRVPIIQGVDVRVDVGPEGTIVAATLSHPSGQMQVGVYAAPRTEGIWDDVRKEILAQIASQGGTGQQTRGTFGPEINARLPVQGGSQPARFLGVNGPRWFLRALLTGPAATDPKRAAPLEQALRQIVVVRGDEPMPVRDPLPLRLPPDLAEQATRQQQEQQAPSPNGTDPRRGRPGPP
ncbi:MAG TPA: DUF3710 domain-containing protein [Mycobacteriales bacterium]|nr:DUF3710 domain-containing protein [Mycobacteriales bacterium]